MSHDTWEHHLDDLLKRYFRGDPATPGMHRRQDSIRCAASQRGPKRRHPSIPLNTTNTGAEVGVDSMKAIKGLIRKTSGEQQTQALQRVLDAVRMILRQKKVKALPLALKLCDELFERAAAFRALVATQCGPFFDDLLRAASAMSGRGKATVRVHARATQQTPDVNAVLALVEKWKEAHGAKYPALTAGHAVLEEEGYVFPHAKAKETAKAAEAEQLQLHQTRVAALKRAQVEKEIAQYTQEIEDVLLEMHRIFEILVPTLEAFSFDEDTAVETLPPSAPTTVSTPPRPGKNGCEASSDTDQAEHLANAVAGDNEDDEDDDDDVEWEDVGDDGGNGSADDEVATRQEELEAMDMNDIVQAYGLGSAAYELTISIPSTLCERSSENEVLFRSLADSVLRIRKRFLPLIDDWSNALTIDTGTNADANVEHFRLAAKVTDLRCRLDQATMKWEDLVKESERKRFAHIRPTVVSVPLSAYKRHKPPTADRRRRSEPSALA